MLWKERSPKGKHSIVAGNPGTSWKVTDVVLDGINSIQGKSMTVFIGRSLTRYYQTRYT